MLTIFASVLIGIGTQSWLVGFGVFFASCAIEFQLKK